jgi:hypothetical protein
MSTKQTLLQPVKGLLLLVVISAFVSTRLLAQDEPVTKQTPPLPNQAAAYANGTVMKTSTSLYPVDVLGTNTTSTDVYITARNLNTNTLYWFYCGPGDNNELITTFPDGPYYVTLLPLGGYTTFYYNVSCGYTTSGPGSTQVQLSYVWFSSSCNTIRINH